MTAKQVKATRAAARSSAAKRRPIEDDNREPATMRMALSLGGCWCEQPAGHDWPGKADGAPHPRQRP